MYTGGMQLIKDHEMKKMSKRGLLVVMFALGLCLLVFSVVVFRQIVMPVTGISCSKAADGNFAREIWDSDQKTVEILARHRGTITISLNTTKCKGKAFISLTYDTEAHRRELQKIISESSLKRLPIEWANT
jgi:hypothetical protein